MRGGVVALASAALTLATSCASTDASSEQSERADIYRAFLAAQFNDMRLINLSDHAMPLHILPPELTDCAPARVFADSAASGESPMPTAMALGENVRLVSAKSHDETAGGLLQLSDILMDRSGQYAVLAFDFGCGPICGGGGNAVLVRLENAWRFERLCGILWNE